MIKSLRILMPMLLLCGCLKDEVDVEAMTTNPMDPENHATELVVVDSIITESYAQGLHYRQGIHVHVMTGSLPSGMGYTLYVRESGVDVPQANVPGLPQHHYIYRRSLVDLGTTYCYALEVKVDGYILDAKEQCALAEL